MADNYNNFTYIPKEHACHWLVGRVLKVRTDSQAVLCTSKNINQWSYYKPVPSHLHGNITDIQRDEMFYDTNDGFTIPVFGSPKEAVEALEKGTAAWTYNRPKGGDYDEWFRLRDFEEYESSATDWFKSWAGIMSGTYKNTYRCTMPGIPVVGDVYSMVEKFAAWPKTKTSDNKELSRYRVGYIAWIVGDPQGVAYFVNFGQLDGIRSQTPMIDTTVDGVPLGKTLKFAPVITSYGFDSDEPGITDPTLGVDMERIVTWNRCRLTQAQGGTDFYFEKKDGWWILPVEPQTITFEESGNSGETEMPKHVRVIMDTNRYPRYDQVIVEGVYTGCRVYLKLDIAVDPFEYDTRIELYARINTPLNLYTYRTTIPKDTSAAVDLFVPECDDGYVYSHYLTNISRYVPETHELEMFISKDNYLPDGGIQVEIEIVADTRSQTGRVFLRPEKIIP